MDKIKVFSGLSIIIILTFSCATQNQMRYTYIKPKLLKKEGTVYLEASKAQLTKRADELLNVNFKSVKEKTIIPPSGNKQDYHSRAIYLWPSKDPNRKIWEARDGEINKHSLMNTDHNNYYEMLSAVKTLSLAYHLDGEERYAEKSSDLIRKWFVNEETRMNPHFNFAQAVPGKSDGSAAGIIDSRGIIWIIESVQLIDETIFWDSTDNVEFTEWCSQLLDWLMTSEYGKEADSKANNFGSFYDLQTAYISQFLGRDDLAVEILNNAKRKRISNQINKDGSQPHEMERSSPHMYSIFNLSALVYLADLAQNYSIDLWSYKDATHGSIEDAVDYLVENYKQNNTKLFKGKVSYKNMMRILPTANELSNGKYDGIINKLSDEYKNFDLTEIYFVN